MHTESVNFKITLFCNPISSHHFPWMEPQCWVRNGLVQRAGCTRYANGDALNLKEHGHTRGRHNQTVLFFSTTRGSNLKQFSEITLHWNFDDLLLVLILNSISFITFPSSLPFRFLERKIRIFAETQENNNFRSRDPSTGFHILFWSCILFWWTSKRISQLPRLWKGDTPRNNGVFLLLVARRVNF